MLSSSRRMLTIRTTSNGRLIKLIRAKSINYPAIMTDKIHIVSKVIESSSNSFVRPEILIYVIEKFNKSSIKIISYIDL